MFQRLAKKLLPALLALSITHVHAQTTTAGSNPKSGKENNPYSRYGIGEFTNGNNVVLRGMGNITSAYASPFRVNTDNPASYSFLRRTTFELAANASTRNVHGTVNGTSQAYSSATASVAYMNLGVPIGKNGGMSFGFRPNSQVYYLLVDSGFYAPLDTLLKRYEGEGSTNYAFIGGSYRYKGLSIGVNVGYLFGNVRNSSFMYPVASTTTKYGFISNYSTYTQVGGVHWKGGLQYEKKLDSFHVLRIGGTVTLGQDLKQHYSEYHISSYNFSDTIIRDSSVKITDKVGTLTLPMSYSAGVMFGREGKWSAGIDYTATNWSTFNSSLNPQMNANVGTDAYKLSVGGEYTPDAEAMRNLLSRSTYRLGVYYGTDYLRVNNVILPKYGVTAGFSTSFKRSISQLHVAVDAGVLGTTEHNLVRQNYIRLTIGLSMNDLWFVRPKLQ